MPDNPPYKGNDYQMKFSIKSFFKKVFLSILLIYIYLKYFVFRDTE